MKTAVLFSLPALPLIAALAFSGRPVSPGVPAPEIDRSPSDVALISPARAVTANTTADTASLVDLKGGSVLAEVPVGKHPFAVEASRDGKHAIVTNWLGDSVTVLDVSASGLTPSAEIPVGDEPRGAALTPDGNTAYVALGGENRVAQLDLKSRKVTRSFAVGVEPWHVALTPDGRRLAVGNARGQSVTVVDLTTGDASHTVKLGGRNVRHLAVSPDGKWAYVPHIAERGRPVDKENIDWGWVVGNRLSRVPLTESGPREAMTLDPRGKAVGDVDGVAVSPDGGTFAVTASGTHEVLLLRSALPFVAYGGPEDHIDGTLLMDARRFRRVDLGGRPLGTAFSSDGKTVVVANYLRNSVQSVDVEKGAVIGEVTLGGPKEPSLARRGEAVFYDATRSFHQWYSCSTCHVEGHTGGGNFDTLNDGTYNTTKQTPSLRGVGKTGPYTWHGSKKELRTVAHDSLLLSMQGPEPRGEDLDALTAFLKTLDFVPNPNRGAGGVLSAAAQRGETLFKAKGCDTCHAGPNYTSEGAYKVGLEAEFDAFPGYNPPTLRGLHARGPYLHDGRARTLEAVVTMWHTPSKLTGKPDLTPQEVPDLIAFLKSL